LPVGLCDEEVRTD